MKKTDDLKTRNKSRAKGDGGKQEKRLQLWKSILMILTQAKKKSDYGILNAADLISLTALWGY